MKRPRTISGALAGRGRPVSPLLQQARDRDRAQSSGGPTGGQTGGAASGSASDALKAGLATLSDLIKEAASAPDGLAERMGKLDLSGTTGKDGLTMDYGIKVQFGLGGKGGKGSGGGGGGGRPNDPPPKLPPSGPSGLDIAPFEVQDVGDRVLLSAPVEELDLSRLNMQLSDDARELHLIDTEREELVQTMELPFPVDRDSGDYILSGNTLQIGIDKAKS